MVCLPVIFPRVLGCLLASALYGLGMLASASSELRGVLCQTSEVQMLALWLSLSLLLSLPVSHSLDSINSQLRALDMRDDLATGVSTVAMFIE
jgi:hypothetical protein